MAAVDTITQFQTALPNVELIQCTATDGETYTSREFAYVDAVFVQLAEDTGSLSIPVSVAVASNNVITFHCTGLSDNVINVEIWGH